MNFFQNGLSSLPLLREGKSRSINWENRNGEKGKGGMRSEERRVGKECL